jgi:putative polyhydroxyalkanoate system protein
MAKLSIEHKTTHSKEAIRSKLSEIMGKVEESYGLTGSWSGDTYSFKRKGLDGAATIVDQKVTIAMEMGMLLGAFKGKIESELRARLMKGLP